MLRVPEGYVQQSGGVVETPAKTELAALCNFEAPHRCPAELTAIVMHDRAPKEFDGGPSPGR